MPIERKFDETAGTRTSKEFHNVYLLQATPMVLVTAERFSSIFMADRR